MDGFFRIGSIVLAVIFGSKVAFMITSTKPPLWISADDQVDNAKYGRDNRDKVDNQGHYDIYVDGLAGFAGQA